MRGGTEPLDPTSPRVQCERCGARQAAVLFKGDDVQPPLRQRLCEECADIESGRKLLRIIRQSAQEVPEGFFDNLTDDQIRDLKKRFTDRGNWGE